MATTLCSYVDARVTIDGEPFNELLRNAIQLQSLGEPRDPLKLYIAVAGLKHCGERMYNMVKQKRNPFMYPERALQNFFRNESNNKFKSDLELHSKVSTDFDAPANWLEQSITRLRIGTSTLMTVFGRDLAKEHSEVQKLSEAAIYNYASFASLARANRSWILRLENAPFERALAGCLIKDNGEKIRSLMQYIEDGPTASFEPLYQNLSKIVVKNKAYFPVHPLTRFF